MPDSSEFDLIVVGGGAAGFFAAITCAENAPDARILILEKSSKVLGKVKISGGGRCNVTHACFDPRELTTSYPRGSKQLIGPFHRWGPTETMEWFESRGVPLKIEKDNRVFPESDDSQSVIDCLTTAAKKAGVEVRRSAAVELADQLKSGLFEVAPAQSGGLRSTKHPTALEAAARTQRLNLMNVLRCRNLLLTTGGARDAGGPRIASGFGHGIEPPAPSLFTFKIDDPRLAGLQGLSVADARVRVAPSNNSRELEAAGPILITHWGLSGPGILRVSAWGARAFLQLGYRFEASVDWTGGSDGADLADEIDSLRAEAPKRTIVNDPRFGIPSRLWRRLAEAALGESGMSEKDIMDLRWPHLSKAGARLLVQQLSDCRFRVTGKSMNKEEFVTCGGVNLDEVNFKTMESRVTPGLFFAGELLDIDGITGGFNFQSAWTTGRVAGEAIAERIQKQS